MICVQTGILRGPPTRMTRRGIEAGRRQRLSVAASRAPCDHQSTAQLPETSNLRGTRRTPRGPSRGRASGSNGGPSFPAGIIAAAL